MKKRQRERHDRSKQPHPKASSDERGQRIQLASCSFQRRGDNRQMNQIEKESRSNILESFSRLGVSSRRAGYGVVVLCSNPNRRRMKRSQAV
jgi:hypothetical protein